MFSSYGTLFPPPIFFPLSLPSDAHHSAANAVSERNLQQEVVKTHQNLQQKNRKT